MIRSLTMVGLVAALLLGIGCDTEQASGNGEGEQLPVGECPAECAESVYNIASLQDEAAAIQESANTFNAENEESEVALITPPVDQCAVTGCNPLKAEYEILERENEANRAQLEAAKKELEAAKQAELDKTISAAKTGYKTQIVDVRELNAPKYLKVTLKENLPPNLSEHPGDDHCYFRLPTTQWKVTSPLPNSQWKGMTGRVLLYRYKYKDGSEEVHEGNIEYESHAIGTPSANDNPKCLEKHQYYVDFHDAGIDRLITDLDDNERIMEMDFLIVLYEDF